MGTESADERLDRAIENGPTRVIKDYELMNWFRRKKGLGGAAGGAKSYTTGGGYAPSTGYQPLPVKPYCKHKGTRVFGLGPKGKDGAPLITFWAIQSAEIRALAHGLDLWMPLNGDQSSTMGQFVRAAKGGDEIVEFAASLKPRDVPMIALDWPDRSIPMVSPGVFWPTLLKGLVGLAQKKGESTFHIAFSCVGSHGRTGTALACTLTLAGMKAGDAIKTIRAIHCEEAIEGKVQEDYIAWVDEKVEKSIMPITLYPKAEKEGEAK